MTTRLLSSAAAFGLITAVALSLSACGSSPGCRAATGAGLGAAGGAAIGAAAGNPVAGAVAGGVAGAAVGGTTSPDTVSAGPGPC
jgi:osmotically inducible lipoprotein OsmB